MTKLGDDRDQKAAGKGPAQESESFASWSQLHPLMANPAAAMAAATAIGIGLTTQIAGAFFGALQGAMEASNRLGAGAGSPSARAPHSEEAGMPTPTAAEAETVVPERPEAVGEAAVAAKLAAETPVAKKPVARRAGAKRAAKADPAEAKAEPIATSPAKVEPAEVLPVADPVDDLKRISGIGPKLEKVLNGMGVTSVAQIAAWKKTDIARFDKKLGFQGRISRDDWVGQAKALMH